MIEFKPVQLEDKAVIENYTMPSGICNCDLAFANMYCWQSMYHSAWAVIDDFLVIRFRIGGGSKIGYMQPIGKGDFSRIIPALTEDAHANGQRLRLIGLTDEGREMIGQMHIGLFAFESDRAYEDYIYNTEDLRTLAGRRYQPKRNHINRFMSEYPDYRYEPLTGEHFEPCMQLERQWRALHDGRTSELCAEQRAMQRAFAHFGELGMIGGTIYVGDKLVAFTYGSAVNDHTFVTHVEKADTAYDSAFTIINKLFAEHLPPHFTLINREEDLGIEGLRHSKLSYHPAFLQHKFTAIRLHTDERAVKALWQEAFGDGDAFIDAFLIRHYRRDRMLSDERDEVLASMLHLVPFDTEQGRMTYVYGVATATTHRGRGLASELLRQAEARCREQGDVALFLIPSGEGLRDYYARLGYSGDIPVGLTATDGFDFGTGTADKDRAMILPLRNSFEMPDALRGHLAEVNPVEKTDGQHLHGKERHATRDCQATAVV